MRLRKLPQSVMLLLMSVMFVVAGCQPLVSPYDAMESGVDSQTEKPAQPKTEKPAQPKTEKPAQPKTEKPAQPKTEEPAQPKTEEPAQPQTEKPAQPKTEKPTQPKTEKPTQPKTEEPAQPKTEEPAQPKPEKPAVLPSKTMEEEIRALIPKGAVLKHPTNAGYYQFGDINGDLKKEAFAIYTNGIQPDLKLPLSYLLVMEFINNRWTPMETIQLAGHELHDARFFDFDIDGDSEIAVGTKQGLDDEKTLEAFYYKSGNIVKAFEDRYQKLEVGVFRDDEGKKNPKDERMVLYSTFNLYVLDAYMVNVLEWSEDWPVHNYITTRYPEVLNRNIEFLKNKVKESNGAALYWYALGVSYLTANRQSEGYNALLKADQVPYAYEDKIRFKQTISQLLEN